MSRVTGRWPLQVFGGLAFPGRLDTCRGCGEFEISVVQTLCVCVGLASLREDVRTHGKLPPPSNVSAFLLGLFREGPPVDQRALHVEFVGRALGFACGPMAANGTNVDDHVDSELTSVTSVDALFRIESEQAACANNDAPMGAADLDEL